MTKHSTLFSQKDLDILVPAIYRTWQEIGSDYLALFDSGEYPGNESCIEGCIDADRLQDSAAEAVLDEALDKATYTRVLRQLGKVVTLV